MSLLHPPHRALPLLKARAHLGFYGIATEIRWAELLDPSPHASLLAQEHRDAVASHHGNSMNTGPPPSPSFVSLIHASHKTKQEKARGMARHFSRSIAWEVLAPSACQVFAPISQCGCRQSHGLAHPKPASTFSHAGSALWLMYVRSPE